MSVRATYLTAAGVPDSVRAGWGVEATRRYDQCFRHRVPQRLCRTHVIEVLYGQHVICTEVLVKVIVGPIPILHPHRIAPRTPKALHYLGKLVGLIL